MIFKTLQMENIRSYEKEKIDFPSGTSLFEGDVGSGKSTILMALEFALFGLGNQKGDALLRKGSKKGSVLLSFSVGENEYKIKRTLLRGKNDSIKQDKALLNADGNRMQLSPSEIKERILDILNFKEPSNPRAQSVIYRYAVYTPQEEMKFILSQRPDDRLQTLRKAFGIEDYKTAAENASLISRQIKEKVSFLSGQVSDLEEKRNTLTELNGKLAENNEKLTRYIVKRDELETTLKGQKEELEKLKVKESELQQIEKEIPHVEQQIADKNELSGKYQREIQDAEKENTERLIPEIEKLKKLEKPTNLSPEELKEKIVQLNDAMGSRKESVTTLNVLRDQKQDLLKKLSEWKDRSREEFDRENQELNRKLNESKKLLAQHQREVNVILEKIYRLKGKMDDINEKLDNLDDLGETCPICGSTLDDEHKKDLKAERAREVRRLNSEINGLNVVKEKGKKQLETDTLDIEQIKNDLNNFKLMIEKYNELGSVKTKISSLEGNISNIDERLSLNIQENVQFANFEKYIDHLQNLLDKLKQYNQAQITLENFNYQFHKNNDKIEANRREIGTLQVDVEGLNKNLYTLKEKIKQLPEVTQGVSNQQSIYDETGKEYRSTNDDVIKTQTLVERLAEDVLELEDVINEKESLQNQLNTLKDYHSWITDYLIPTLSVIEKHVMQNIHMEFDESFKKWFNLLIDDPSKTGRIDEEFTPIIEQDRYQQEINYLSGGEKTSVALSYRLALNNIVQKVSTGMKSNIIIMDEPTDGFSKEQLFKIRDILNELDYPQIIIVSHERELESFANNIFQIEKVDGVSQVTHVT